MDIPLPSTNINIFTIYSISSCPYCVRAKELLDKDNTVVINCDEFRKNDREGFLKFMDELTHINHRTFPMIFHGTKFIGGFDKTEIYYKELIAKEKAIKEMIQIDDF